MPLGDGSAADCYFNGYAGWSEAHLQSVVKNADGVWRAYLDGGYSGISVTFYGSCGGGGDACEVTAFGEEHSNTAGYWPAKFAGSGNTPWERWTGSTWYEIQQSGTYTDTYWSIGGPFPDGIWNSTYDHPTG